MAHSRKIAVIGLGYVGLPVAAAFAAAHLVVRMPLRNTRVVIAPLEPRAALCRYDAASERFTFVLSGQGVFPSSPSRPRSSSRGDPPRILTLKWCVQPR